MHISVPLVTTWSVETEPDGVLVVLGTAAAMRLSINEALRFRNALDQHIAQVGNLALPTIVVPQRAVLTGTLT